MISTLVMENRTLKAKIGNYVKVIIKRDETVHHLEDKINYLKDEIKGYINVNYNKQKEPG